MLARVADSLFWFGRYIERSEHLARFTKIQYFSALDAPLLHKQDAVLRAIAQMAGLGPEAAQAGEAELLLQVGLDRSVPNSLLSSICQARTNARGTRDLLSSELWEAVNKFYHFAIAYPADVFKTRGLYDFMQQSLAQCMVIKGAAENTLLHDQVWAFIQSGIYLERALQIVRILQVKLADIAAARSSQEGLAAENYQISTLLSATEGFDMSRRYYKSEVDSSMAIDFLILNPVFPRSISYSLRKLLSYLERIQPAAQQGPGSVAFAAGKLSATLQFLTSADLEEPEAFLATLQGHLFQIGHLMNETYLKY